MLKAPLECVLYAVERQSIVAGFVNERRTDCVLVVPGNSKPESEWNYRRRTGWPSEPTMLIDVGIISDVQCGFVATRTIYGESDLLFRIGDGQLPY